MNKIVASRREQYKLAASALPKYYAEENLKLLQLARKFYSFQEIADYLGVTKQAIFLKMQKLERNNREA